MATSPVTEFGVKDIRALHEALCPVSARYKFFGLQIGVDINEMKPIIKIQVKFCLKFCVHVYIKNQLSLVLTFVKHFDHKL